MFHRITKILGLLLLVTFSLQTVGSPQAAEHPVQVVLLAGQSNMGGAGNYEELASSVIERIQKVSSRVSVSLGGRKPQPLSYEVSKFHQDKYGIAKKFGPELFVGLTLAEKYPDREYLLLKTVQGGTSLYGAWNPQWTAEKAKRVERGSVKQNLQLYTLHLTNVRSNLARLEQDEKLYNIIGMLWMQGENDAAKEVAANSYKANLLRLINGYRSELEVSTMSFVIGQINSTYGRYPSGPDMVRAAMADVTNMLPNTALISTSTDRSWHDYPKHSDNVHYNTLGQTRLGIAFAETLNSLTNPQLDASNK
ncbi:sialate O-acetylesterase [Paraglaciecola sp. 20A4]|uniref:sialate O-acetylesterase n=1 Tax=Paraglaciecola sp. 20A4 TaxID=2687288 RepID=UPI001409337D|nr:sialate O-acetylesterase [Paraglaciecola sp. 20A4]